MVCIRPEGLEPGTYVNDYLAGMSPLAPPTQFTRLNTRHAVSKEEAPLSPPTSDRVKHHVCIGYSMNKQSHQPLSDRIAHVYTTVKPHIEPINERDWTKRTNERP